MFKKICTSLFLFTHLCVCSFSFAEEVVAEVLEAVIPLESAPVLPEVALEPVPVAEIPLIEENIPVVTPEVTNSVTPEVVPMEALPEEINIEIPSTEYIIESEILSEEDILPLTEEAPATNVAMEEVIVISEPPAPEPEPWQPSTVDNSPDLPE